MYDNLTAVSEDASISLNNLSYLKDSIAMKSENECGASSIF